MPCKTVKVVKEVNIYLPEGQSWKKVEYRTKPTWRGRMMQMMRMLRQVLT